MEQQFLKILYVNVIEYNAGWGAEWFVDRGFRSLGHQTFCVDYRRHRGDLAKKIRNAPEHDVLLLQRGDFVPIEVIHGTHGPRFFWASELVSRCRDQDPLIRSGLFDHIFFHSQACVEKVVASGWVARRRCSVLLNGFDETIHRPMTGVKKDIDLLFVGNLTSRRHAMLEALSKHSRVTVADAYGQDLVQLFNRAKIVLNIHAEEFLDTETRVFETLGCGAFLLTEKLSEDNPFTGAHFAQFESLDELCEKAHCYLENTAERNEIANSGRDEALAFHTYTHRAGEIAGIMSRSLSDRGKRASEAWANMPVGGRREKPMEKCQEDSHLRCLLTEDSSNSTLSEKNSHKKRLRIFAAFHQSNWEKPNLLPALEHFGEVIWYDWSPKYDQYDSRWHVWGKQEMNAELLGHIEKAHKERPIDLFFGYLSGRLVFPGTIRAIGKLGIPTLNLCLDDETKFSSVLEPTGFAGMCDIANAFRLCWTSSRKAVAEYESVGANVLYMPPGANEQVFFPHHLEKDIDVCFCGQRYGQRPRMIDALRRKGINVITFGEGWDGGSLSTEDMVKLYSRSKIVLGISTVGDSSGVVCIKGRDFEVPMSGGFYLTQYHPDLAAFFEMGKEIVCYRSMEDLVGKIRFYLGHEKEREMIRQAGFRRSVKDHTWVRRFQKALDTMEIVWQEESDATPLSENKGSPPVNTKDDWTYYLRVGQEASRKKAIIREFVLKQKGIQTILDVGCNRGDMSAQFLDHGMQVLGVDASERVRPKNGFRFLRRDISTWNDIVVNHCTLFLSLYHHLFNSQGKDGADEIFYKLLLRTNYLIFDSGSLLEQGPDRQRWVKALQQNFRSDAEMLMHFGVSYETLGTWATGGAKREIVAFRKMDFDNAVEVVGEFRRKEGSENQGQGLFPVEQRDAGERFFNRTFFYKLKLGNRYFFAKKHLLDAWERSELENTIEVYERFPSEELLTFFGVSQRFGLIYEWVDNIRYVGKLRDVTVHGVLLRDADVIEVDGEKKYIDFWSDPETVTPKVGVNENSQILVGETSSNFGTHEDRMHDRRAVDLTNNPYNSEDTYHMVTGKGSYYETLGDFGEALVWFNKALEIKESPDILNKIGNCHMQLEALPEAYAVYSQSILLDKKQATIRALLQGIEEICPGI